MRHFGDNRAGASFSDDGTRRYAWSRTLVDHDGIYTPISVAWNMLNPSDAGPDTDDPTTRRVRDFTMRLVEHCYTTQEIVRRGVVVAIANLTAKISTDPRGISDEPEHFADDMRALDMVNASAAAVVLAWGANARRVARRRARVVDTLAAFNSGPAPQQLLVCLGRTGDGEPRHPVRLAKSTRFIRLRASAAVAGARDAVLLERGPLALLRGAA